MTTAATNVWTVARADDRIVGVLLIGVGMILLSLVLFSDGALIALALGVGSEPGPLHELLHDGRHLRGAPCH
jgi:hypothetical protein